MQRTLIFYSFLTFVLLPIATILGVACVMSLPSALGNPKDLLDVFILASFVLYTYASFYFFTRGIQSGKVFKASMKDFIKVNGFVVLISSAMSVIALLLFYTAPAFKTFFVGLLMQLQATAPATGMDKKQLTALLGKTLIGSGVYSALIILHFFITLKLTRRYGYLFAKKEE